MPTANLPTNRTTSTSTPDHTADHNTAHAIANLSQIVIRWNATSKVWEQLRGSWPWGVIFDGSNDPTATFPPTTGLLVGDKLDLHPDSPLLPQNQ